MAVNKKVFNLVTANVPEVLNAPFRKFRVLSITPTAAVVTAQITDPGQSTSTGEPFVISAAPPSRLRRPLEMEPWTALSIISDTGNTQVIGYWSLTDDFINDPPGNSGGSGASTIMEVIDNTTAAATPVSGTTFTETGATIKAADELLEGVVLLNGIDNNSNIPAPISSTPLGSLTLAPTNELLGTASALYAFTDQYNEADAVGGFFLGPTFSTNGYNMIADDFVVETAAMVNGVDAVTQLPAAITSQAVAFSGGPTTEGLNVTALIIDDVSDVQVNLEGSAETGSVNVEQVQADIGFNPQSAPSPGTPIDCHRFSAVRLVVLTSDAVATFAVTDQNGNTVQMYPAAGGASVALLAGGTTAGTTVYVPVAGCTKLNLVATALWTFNLSFGPHFFKP